MIRFFICVVIVLSALIFFHPPQAYAWTDDVEGVLMPSPGCEGNMSDMDTIMEAMDDAPDERSGDTGPMIEWD